MLLGLGDGGCNTLACLIEKNYFNDFQEVNYTAIHHNNALISQSNVGSTFLIDPQQLAEDNVKISGSVNRYLCQYINDQFKKVDAFLTLPDFKDTNNIKLTSNYLNIRSLQEYVLIEQDFADIEVVQRSQGWQSKHYFPGDEVSFESIDLKLTVEEIYLRVHNEDMIKFLSQKDEG